jgi:light-regulated signal transduction histidine kinase (bacteriophytochrome)
MPSPYYFEGRKVMMKCTELLKAMHDQETKLLRERAESRKVYQQITADTLKYLLLVFSLITILLFALMLREFRRRIDYQQQLQVKLLDLRRSHTELEQIAYAASHDLQEPLRKIQVFSNRLVWLKKDKMDDDSKATMERVNEAAGRMQELIEDLVNLTSLTKEDIKKESIDLNIVLRNVINDLDAKIEEKHAIIKNQPLPKVKGSLEQLSILFKALLDNAIKFSKDDLAPEISITSDEVTGEELAEINKGLARKRFYRISISDNGIGFDNKFGYKLFRIFQRLHGRESQYEGKGIGLAICQRIMTNHEGHILAHGHSQVGATFKLFFPIEE